MSAIDPSSPDPFDRWVARIRPRLVRSAESLLKDRAEAENVVQASLMAVWEAQRKQASEDLDAYAKRAVWLNALRLRARRRSWEELPAGEGASDALRVASFPPEAGQELASWELERAILDLPPAQQAVIRLRFYAGMSFQEIGETLAISINTAASRCRYALGALRARLGASHPKEEADHE